VRRAILVVQSGQCSLQPFNSHTLLASASSDSLGLTFRCGFVLGFRRESAADRSARPQRPTWANRLKRVREYVPGLFGKVSAWRSGVQRTSNAYSFNDPASSKSEFQTETTTQKLTERKIANAVRLAHAITSRTVATEPLSVERTRPVSTCRA
jgi:hypothetical protein